MLHEETQSMTPKEPFMAQPHHDKAFTLGCWWLLVHHHYHDDPGPAVVLTAMHAADLMMTYIEMMLR